MWFPLVLRLRYRTHKRNRIIADRFFAEAVLVARNLQGESSMETERKTCASCAYFIDLSPDEGACSKPKGGRNGVWGNEDICCDYEEDEK